VIPGDEIETQTRSDAVNPASFIPTNHKLKGGQGDNRARTEGGSEREREKETLPILDQYWEKKRWSQITCISEERGGGVGNYQLPPQAR